MNKSNVGRVYSLILLFFILSLSLIYPASPLRAAVGNLETPMPGSVQSGVALVRGWVCSATRVEIEVDGQATVPAVYGEARGDTQAACGDSDNGFSLQINWNELKEGVHTVRALADGETLGSAVVSVATLGQTFLRGAQGEFLVQPFPANGQTTRLRWLESRQQFVLANDGSPSTGGGNARTDAQLEDPQPGSFQSGIGVIRGWVCTATRVEVEVDGRGLVAAAYGELRGDTQPVCGDSNNGFSAQVNWNDFGDGPHTMRVLADGSEFGRATFTVVTLGLGSFPRGLSGAFTLPNFPKQEMVTTVAWQESQQNFVVTGALYPGISEGLCTTQQGEVQDRQGGRATIRWSNPCLLSGNLAVQHYQVPTKSASVSLLSSPTVDSGDREPRAATDGGFFLCESSLAIQQSGRVFTGDDFRLVDLTGTEVCRELSPGTSLDVLLQVEATSDLNFNTPFVAAYENRDIVTFVEDPPQTGGTPTLTLSTGEIDFNATPVGVFSLRGITSPTSGISAEREARLQSGVTQEKTFTLTNSGTGVLKGGLTLIAAGSGSNVFTLVSDDTFRIEPGQSQTVTLRYTAVDNTPTTGSLRVSTNGGVKSVVLCGSGTIGGQLPPQPQLIVQPTSLDFGQVQVGQMADRTLTVTNTGGGTLTGSISTSAPFSLVGNGSFNLTATQSQTVTIRFTPTGSPIFSGSATLNSNAGTATVALTGQGAPCTFTLSATSAQVAAAGGPGSVSVSAASGCSWTAMSNVPWITVTSGIRGSGNGTVNYTVAANPDGSVRTGTLPIAGQTFTVTQGARPLYLLTIGKTGTGSGTVTSSPGGINCGTDCTESYIEGTVVTLTATVSEGSTFAGWTGDCLGEGISISVTMTTNRSCTATFNVARNTQIFNNAADFRAALGGVLSLVEDFESRAVGDTLKGVEILPGLVVDTNMANLEVFSSSGDHRMFGFDNTTRQNGNAFYELTLTSDYTAVSFVIEGWDPASPGPITLEISFSDGSVQTIKLTKDPKLSETDPVFFGIISNGLFIDKIVLREGPEISGSGNEEVALDDIIVAP